MNEVLFLGAADPFSSLSHLAGALLAIMRTAPLLRRADVNSSRRPYLLVFTLSAVFLLTMSAAYHSFPRGSAGRDLLQRLDHVAIFALIAGTITACHGLLFKGIWRGGMIGVIWTIGIGGSVLQAFFIEQVSEQTSLFLYLVMGWLGGVAIVKLFMGGSRRTAFFLCLGGVFYTVGALVDQFGGRTLALVPGVIGPHEFFHVTVLLGLAIHWGLLHQVAATPEPLSNEPVPLVSSSLSGASAVGVLKVASN